MSVLPAAIRGAIATLAAGYRLPELRRAQDAVSRGYRAGRTSGHAVATEVDALAYLVGRLPATYAAVEAALAALVEARPDFAPGAVLDIGCGPGTATLAALARFASLRRAAGVDRNARFLAIAARLVAATGLAGGCAVRFDAGDYGAAIAADPADLVIAAYTLVESPEPAVARVVLPLWDLSRDALVLVEPGSTAGFARLRAARAALIGAGATILAPCTHRRDCPIAGPDWCHFSVRLARSREHRLVKHADAPFEDEKFSYLVAARAGAPAHGARILGPVSHARSGHVARLCRAGRIETLTVGPGDPAFRAAKKWSWGDGIP